MMEWYQILSCFLTNSIRGFLGLYLVCGLLSARMELRRTVMISAAAAAAITALPLLSVSGAGVLGAEIILLAAASRVYLPREQTRMSLFILFFYEIAAALWEFIISSLFAIAFCVGYLARWCVSHQAIDAFWPCLTGQESSAAMVRGMEAMTEGYLNGPVGAAFPEEQLWMRFLDSGAPEHLLAVTLGSQTVIAIPEDELAMWNLLSVILMFSVLVYNLNRHYEAEKEIVRLKEEQAELLDRDYQSLNRLYSENARLFHDLHNHIELLHRHLTHGNVNEAVEYLEDLRGPVREITNSGWTGDEAVDYLIGNKTAAAQEQQIAAEVNMEFPRHTNIRSADLTAILGNLLDNALEAAKKVRGDQRFIRLTVRRIYNMLVIKVENGCEAPPVAKQGELITSKTEGGLHGWGLKSVRAAAEKYDGIVETMYEDHVFRAVVTLSF